MEGKRRSVEEDWELTEYEKQRKPQEIADDDVESAVLPRSLHKELMCPICLEIMKKTMTTKDCLHRFCANCIITALRNGNKECPTCREKLVSKRSLRPDVNFDLLISKIYPNLDKYEAEHDKVIAQLNTSYMNTLTENNILQQGVQNRSETKSEQSSQNMKDEKKKRTTKHRSYFSISEHLSNFLQDNNFESTSDQLPIKNDTTNDSASTSNEIEIILTPHPFIETSTNNDEKRFIKTPGTTTVDHLKKYLIMRQNIECDLKLSDKDICELINNVHIFIAEKPNNFIELDGSETLQQLKEKFCKDTEPLNLYHSPIELNCK
ncbi:hypothetical protein PV328_009508 [Microctonus aethiopoides]|uniref:RING-type E3 ubiquitin transferase n=1 Tax=Microctonus aethiopoides TaxID=144406 RepID=A0AA39C5Z3_9HYME|nr:hypothetical protein PV328_009508 [Microctonus aethiopoides]